MLKCKVIHKFGLTGLINPDVTNILYAGYFDGVSALVPHVPV
jgi:hypothetical protein